LPLAPSVLGLNPRSTHRVNYLRRDTKSTHSARKLNLTRKITCSVRGSNVRSFEWHKKHTLKSRDIDWKSHFSIGLLWFWLFAFRSWQYCTGTVHPFYLLTSTNSEEDCLHRKIEKWSYLFKFIEFNIARVHIFHHAANHRNYNYSNTRWRYKTYNYCII
jgi:hypothetical protein